MTAAEPSTSTPCTKSAVSRLGVMSSNGVTTSGSAGFGGLSGGKMPPIIIARYAEKLSSGIAAPSLTAVGAGVLGLGACDEGKRCGHLLLGDGAGFAGGERAIEPLIHRIGRGKDVIGRGEPG